jgi:DNA-binding XRE family transcriptional regulator
VACTVLRSTERASIRTTAGDTYRYVFTGSDGAPVFWANSRCNEQRSKTDARAVRRPIRVAATEREYFENWLNWTNPALDTDWRFCCIRSVNTRSVDVTTEYPNHGYVQADTSAFQKRLGARIRELRTEKEFSQEGFADACGLHRTHVSLLERGRLNVKIGTIRQIAKVLHTSLSELFQGLG